MANRNGKHLLHVKSNQIIDGKPKLPTPEQIAYGEIAINYADGQEKLSILSSANAIKTISTDEQNENKFASQSALDSKQDTLISGTNIKTINGNSLLGEGNIEIQGGSTVNLAILTQQEYDELVEKDNNTIYFIKG